MGIGLPSSGSLALDIISGPLSLVLGILSGVIFGLLLGFTKILDSKDKRSLATFVFATFIMFLFGAIKGINISAAGAIGSLMLGIVANRAWK